jgi:hypothetical protein
MSDAIEVRNNAVFPAQIAIGVTDRERARERLD